MTQALDEVTVDVAAAPEAVWRMVSDVTRMGEWSPETRRCYWLGRKRGVGAQFVGVNRDRFFVWPTVNRVEESEPGRVFAFRNTGGNILWRYVFEPTDTGTRLVEQRDISQMRAGLVRALYKPMGGYDSRTLTLLAGMQATVDRIKAAAEA